MTALDRLLRLRGVNAIARARTLAAVALATAAVTALTRSGPFGFQVGCSQAPFPSALHTSSRRIVDANGCTLALLKGFNIQIGPWSQSTLDAIAAKGARIERLVLFWNDLQSTNCSSLSPRGAAYVSQVDQQLVWAKKAGIYTELDLHLTNGREAPCARGSTELNEYMNSGKWITQYLAKRYGDVSSPEYTKDVIGFGLNEPPPPNPADATEVNTTMETDQSTMLTWIRGPGGSGGYAPDWIGFVAYPYANATPIFNAVPGQADECETCADANPHAYDAVGGNVIIDVHEYFDGCSDAWLGRKPSFPTLACDGRAHDGEVYHVADGGWAIGTGEATNPAYPPAGEPDATAKGQIARFLYPYTLFSRKANLPLMIGEFGWAPTMNTTGGLTLIHDYMSSWAAASPVIEMEWDYNMSQAADQWAVDPGRSARGVSADGWLSFTDAFLTGSSRPASGARERSG